MVLSRAWYLRCSSLHDVDAQEAHGKRESMIRVVLLQDAPAQPVNAEMLEEAWDWEDASPVSMTAIPSTDVIQKVLHVLLSGPEKYAAAGRAFWAVRRPVLAAQSFTEAMHTCIGVQEVLRSTRVNLCNRGCNSFSKHVCEQEAFLTKQFKSKAQSYARQAAHCWLLVAEGMECATISRLEALKYAESQFGAAGERWMSIICAVKRQRFLNAFRFLADYAEMEFATSRLGLISAVMRHVISRADVNLVEASCLSRLFVEQNLALASRMCLVLCLSFGHISMPWQLRVRVQTRWTALVQKALGQAGWSHLVASLGNLGPHNHRQFWSHLHLISVRIPDRWPAPSWDVFSLLLF